MKPLTLRVRLTALMTLLFGLTLSAAAYAGMTILDQTLKADARANAELVLTNYIDQLESGLDAAKLSAPGVWSQIKYLNAEGNEFTAEEYAKLRDQAVSVYLDSGVELAEDHSPLGPSPFLVQPGSLDIVTAGEITWSDGDEDQAWVGVPVTVGGKPLTVAVSDPMAGVAESTSTLTRLLLFAIPALTAYIAVATWLIVGQALRPVAVITEQVEEISTHNLEQRVPEGRSEDVIGRLAATMNKMLTRLESSRDQQQQFISDAAHELNSPITATSATLQVALAHPDQTDWAATAKILQEENGVLAELADDLLLIAALDEQQQDQILVDVYLEELCCTQALRHRPGLVQVTVNDPGRVRGNPEQLARVIRNLVDNAARHATTQVRVTVNGSEDTVTVEVADDGPGVRPADVERIFKRFTQLDDARARTANRGAGLGLAITKQLVEAHQGTIQVGNQPQGGAVFTIKLPTSPT